MVTISPCRTAKELKLFERVPEILHEKDRYFVPPFPGSISKLFKKSSPFLRHGELHPFIAYREKKPVGRIVAIVNRAHNTYHGDQVGFFGFFDSINDVTVAQSLFAKVKEVLSAKGLTSARGPYCPTINDECGVLTEGFESTPFVMMPYNPSYYPALYEAVGLQKARDLYAFYLSAAVNAPERIEKIVNRVKRSTGIELRPLEMSRLNDELKIIQKLYNETLNRNWGFVPLEYEDLQFAAIDLKAIIDPGLVMFAEKNGEPVGFSMVIPNINEILWRVKSSKGLLRILKFIWYLKTSHPREARLAVLGVSPEFRNKGVASLFYFETLSRGKRKYLGGELSWIDEDNEEIMNGIRVMGGQKYKSYRIYESSL